MKSCTLQDLEEMRLLKRFEYKHLISVEVAEQLLENISNEDIIRVWDVNNQRIVHYSSDYYDTPDYTFFREHHSKQLNRYKVRTRHYSTGDVVWQEEKWRTNRN